MIVAFTGSSQKLTDAQRDAISDRIVELSEDTIVVTGGCVGVDAYVAWTAMFMGLVVITILPENRSKVDPDWRANCHTWEDTPRDYRARNTRMVELAEVVIGFPKTETDGRDIGSGSWMTLRIAQRMGRKVQVYPLDEIEDQSAKSGSNR